MPAIGVYRYNGGGRDGYIANNNGGFFKAYGPDAQVVNGRLRS